MPGYECKRGGGGERGVSLRELIENSWRKRERTRDLLSSFLCLHLLTTSCFPCMWRNSFAITLFDVSEEFWGLHDVAYNAARLQDPAMIALQAASSSLLRDICVIMCNSQEKCSHQHSLPIDVKGKLIRRLYSDSDKYTGCQGRTNGCWRVPRRINM